MANHTGSIRYRQGTSIPVGVLVQSINSLFDAIEAVGMNKVSDDEYLGQCGRLTTGEAGLGETQKSSSGTWDWLGSPLYNVYQHPVMGFYLKVNCYDSGFYPSNQRVLQVSYQVFWSLSNKSAVNPLFVQSTVEQCGGGSSAVESIVNEDCILRASMSDDYFWVCCSGAIDTNVSSLSASQNDRYAPFLFSPVAIGVFGVAGKVIVTTHSHLGRAQAVISVARNTTINTSVSSETADISYRLSAARYWWSSKDGPFTFLGGASAGYLSSSQISTTEKGTRVLSASILAGGKIVEPDFCMLSFAAVSDGDIVNINNDGASNRNYIILEGMGNQNPAPPAFGIYLLHQSSYGKELYTIAAFPWE